VIDELEALKNELQTVRGTLPSRIDVDPEGVEQGLAQLVLTLVEFLRQLLERQAASHGGWQSD
jgi:Gas vesicle protein K